VGTEKREDTRVSGSLEPEADAVQNKAVPRAASGPNDASAPQSRAPRPVPARSAPPGGPGPSSRPPRSYLRERLRSEVLGPRGGRCGAGRPPNAPGKRRAPQPGARTFNGRLL